MNLHPCCFIWLSVVSLDVSHLAVCLAELQVQPGDEQEYCQDEKPDHKKRCRVEPYIDPLSHEQAQERSDDKDGTPCTEHKQLIEIADPVLLLFILFHGC